MIRLWWRSALKGRSLVLRKANSSHLGLAGTRRIFSPDFSKNGFEGTRKSILDLSFTSWSEFLSYCLPLSFVLLYETNKKNILLNGPKLPIDTVFERVDIPLANGLHWIVFREVLNYILLYFFPGLPLVLKKRFNFVVYLLRPFCWLLCESLISPSAIEAWPSRNSFGDFCPSFAFFLKMEQQFILFGGPEFPWFLVFLFRKFSLKESTKFLIWFPFMHLLLSGRLRKSWLIFLV